MAKKMMEANGRRKFRSNVVVDGRPIVVVAPTEGEAREYMSDARLALFLGLHGVALDLANLKFEPLEYSEAANSEFKK